MERTPAEAFPASQMPEKPRLAPWLNFLGLALVFGIAYSQYPLFYHTQNQYFFHGLVGAGFGQLKADWFAKTPDPWPVFTYLVELTYRFLDPRLFYVYFIALLGVYAFSMLGIMSSLFRIDRSRTTYLTFLAIMTALHSPVFGYLSRAILGLPLAESSPHHFNVGRILLLEGVGEKRILGDMLNPATFGVFLLLSVYLFLRGKPFLAVTSAVVAAMFQPSYVLHAGVLTASYMGVMVGRKEGLGRPLGLGLYAFVLILPLLVYAGVMFRPVDPAMWKASQEILIRIAYYPPSIPALWLGATAYLKMAIVVAALYLVRQTDLFWITLLSFVAAVGLTVVQMATGSTSIAVLLPWRISAFLVPLSTLILVGYGVSRLPDRLGRSLPGGRDPLVALSVASLVVLVGAGIVETRWRVDEMRQANGLGVFRFVQATRSPGQVYLIPPNWRNFRLLTGAPAFAERSVIPYNDVGIMEWYRRLRLAYAFYGISEEDTVYRGRQEWRRAAEESQSVAPPTNRKEPSANERCRMLTEVAADYGVTHVVLEGGRLEGCQGWRLAFHDATHEVYTLMR